MAVTLGEIEREVASRLGPYRREAVTSSAAATTFVSNALLSSINLGGLRDLYVLRRGEKTDGTVIAVAADDRVRRVKDYTQSSGTVEIDRAYATPPVANEYVEFHHLHPTNELRHAVHNGLRRTFFLDRVEVTLAGASFARDLTASVAWITQPNQVLGAYYNVVSARTFPAPVTFLNAYRQQSNVWVELSPDPFPYTLSIVAMRPVWTYWKPDAGAYGDQTAMPTDDQDELPTDVMYAASAAHIEAWRVCRERLFHSAKTGLFPNQESCAREFTEQTDAAWKQEGRIETFRFPQPFAYRTVQVP